MEVKIIWGNRLLIELKGKKMTQKQGQGKCV